MALKMRLITKMTLPDGTIVESIPMDMEYPGGPNLIYSLWGQAFALQPLRQEGVLKAFHQTTEVIDD